MQCIPQWGGNPERHVTASQDLLNQLRKVGYDVSLHKLRAKVEV